MENIESKNLVGCCGLYCGLCSKYQSKAPSRCTGCKLGEQHSWCSTWNCCVKKHGYETCAECSKVFNCEIFLRREIAEWIPAKDNLIQIKEAGLKTWLKEQEERESLLEELLNNYNEGRSMSFYCKACSRMPVNLINEAVKELNMKIVTEEINKYDLKAKANILKSIIKNKAVKYNVNMN